MMLSVLSGHTRYSHVTALRGESVNAELLGMKKIVSEDVIRRSLLGMDENKGSSWLEKHLKKCYEPLLTIPWVLDLDATVKPLYGKQEGAEMGYNPTKPGRPSQVYHSYFIANIRFALGVDVQNGKNIAGYYSASHLWKILDELPKVQCTRNIKALIKYNMEKNYKWKNVGCGFESVEDIIKLQGWSQSRRVIIPFVVFLHIILN